MKRKGKGDWRKEETERNTRKGKKKRKKRKGKREWRRDVEKIGRKGKGER